MKRNSAAVFWLLLGGCLMAIFFPLLKEDPVLYRDDIVLLGPLVNVKNLHHFLAYIFWPFNYDLQPVRDASLMLDVLAKRLYGWKIFHWHNLILWFACCALFSQFLTRVKIAKKNRDWLVFLFAIHPVYVMSTGWISARKHLLAFLFFLATLNLYYALRSANGRRRIWLSIGGVLAYTLSVFSQPICAFLPLWLLFSEAIDRDFKLDKLKKVPAVVFSLLALTPVYIYLQLHHYKILYSQPLENPERLRSLDVTNITAPGDILLALGRYFFQLVAPIKYAVIYTAGSPENLFGLVLLPIFLFWCGKTLGWKELSRWFSLFLVGLVIVLTKIRTMFISDTYLLGASLGIWVLFARLWEHYAPNRRKLNFFLAALVGIYLVQSGFNARTWMSDEALWKVSYEKEANCENSASYALALLNNNRPKVALDPLEFHFRTGCKGKATVPLYYLFLYYSHDLPLDRKIELAISDKSPTYPEKKLVLAALYLQKGDANHATQVLDAITAKTPDLVKEFHPTLLKPLSAELQAYCRTKTFKYCRPGKTNE